MISDSRDFTFAIEKTKEINKYDSLHNKRSNFE